MEALGVWVAALPGPPQAPRSSPAAPSRRAMPREVALSNGRLHVAFDDRYVLRDLYWPRVGWENHGIGHRSRLGVHAAGRFAWTDDEDAGWRRAVRFLPGALASDVTLRARAPGVELRIQDVVLQDVDVLLRRVAARPVSGAKPRGAGGVREGREARLYHHLDLHVLGTDLGDTVTHDAASGGLLHFKRDRHFLQNGLAADGRGPSGFACGYKEREGHEGTWRDAEDGALSGNPIAHGSCDGVLELTLPLTQGRESVAWWWVAAAPTAERARALDALVREDPPGRHARAIGAWRALTARRRAPVRGRLEEAYRRSLALVLANCDAGGGILAANDTDITSFNRDTYSYVWPRDGAFVAHALDVAGHPEPAERFLRFMADRFEPEGYLPHKVAVDGLLASSWHASLVDGKEALPIQEDETALMVWALAEHVRMGGDWRLAADLYDRAVRRPCAWMLSYRGRDGLPRPSWDLWEERRGVLTYTAASVVAALEGAAFLAEGMDDATRAAEWREGADEVRAALDHLWLPKEGRFARMRTSEGTLDATEDASLAMLPWLGVLPARDPRVRATMRALWRRLAVAGEVGGVARYVGDHYHRVPDAGDDRAYPGNPWFVCTLWRADWLSMTGRRDEARAVLDWALARAQPSGAMAEQLHPATGAPRSVSPLTWSHAAFVESCWRAAPAAPA